MYVYICIYVCICVTMKTMCPPRALCVSWITFDHLYNAPCLAC